VLDRSRQNYGPTLECRTKKCPRFVFLVVVDLRHIETSPLGSLVTLLQILGEVLCIIPPTFQQAPNLFTLLVLKRGMVDPSILATRRGTPNNPV